MEVPRHWRLQRWRYGLRVSGDGEGKVVGECPTGVRDYVERSKDEHTSAEAMVFEGLVVVVTGTEVE